MLFLDCYGTLVEGDGPVIAAVVADAAERTGLDPVRIDRPWWERFSTLCAESSGPRFRTQYELELHALSDVLHGLGAPLPRRDLEQVLAPLVDYWRGATPYADASELIGSWTVGPVVIVSNIDRADIEPVVRRLPPVAAVVTSEDARAYKPNPKVFQHALDLVGVGPAAVVHVGDSWGSDVVGAAAAGIRAVHIVRAPVQPVQTAEGGVRTVATVSTLTEVAALVGG